jgi:hypothetical protein
MIDKLMSFRIVGWTPSNASLVQHESLVDGLGSRGDIGRRRSMGAVLAACRIPVIVFFAAVLILNISTIG